MEYCPLAQRAPPGGNGFWDIKPDLNLVRRPGHDTWRLRSRGCKWKRWALRQLTGTARPGALERILVVHLHCTTGRAGRSRRLALVGVESLKLRRMPPTMGSSSH